MGEILQTKITEDDIAKEVYRIIDVWTKHSFARGKPLTYYDNWKDDIIEVIWRRLQRDNKNKKIQKEYDEELKGLIKQFEDTSIFFKTIVTNANILRSQAINIASELRKQLSDRKKLKRRKKSPRKNNGVQNE